MRNVPARAKQMLYLSSVMPKAWLSRLQIENLVLMPVFQFVMPGGKVWAITALTDTFLWKVYEDDRLSPNSLLLVGKSMFLCVPVLVLDGTLRNIFGSLRNVFGHLQILSDPTKNLGTLKIKNVTPINVKRLAGIKCLQQFYLSPRKHLLKSIHITELFSAIKSRKPGSADLKA